MININGILWFDKQPPNNPPCITEDEDGQFHRQHASSPSSVNNDLEDLSSEAFPDIISDVDASQSGIGIFFSNIFISR